MIECQLAVSSTGVMQWLERSVDRRLWSIFISRRCAKHGTYSVVVCLSIRLFVFVHVSVTLGYCMKTAKRRITQLMPHDRPRILVSILTSASCSPSAIAELLVCYPIVPSISFSAMNQPKIHLGYERALTYDLDLQSQASQGQGRPSCQKSRSKVKQFKQEIAHRQTDGHTYTHTHGPYVRYQTYFLPCCAVDKKVCLSSSL